MVKVSIIVPVYNVQGYLGICLKSLLAQTLKDIEIICINDGSTDDSLNVLEYFALHDKRIKVINKKNEGPGIARNIGIKEAKGEYIGFVDPDDWVKNEMYEKMYNQAKKLDSDVVICDYIRYRESNKRIVPQFFFQKVFKHLKNVPVKVKAGENINREKLLDTLLVSPCYSVNRIYRRSFLEKYNLEFSEHHCYEDCPFILKSHVLANKVSYVDYAGYIYLIRNNSIVRSDTKKYLDFFKIFKTIETFIAEQNLSERLAVNMYYFKVMNMVWTYQVLPKKEYKTFLRAVHKFLNKREYYALKKKLHIRFKDKFNKILSKFISVTEAENRKTYSLGGIKLKIKMRSPREKVEKYYINLVKKNYKKYPNDTYLLFDCLHDETAEAIDAYSLFQEMRRKHIPAYYVVRKQTELYKKLEKEKNLENVISLTFSPRTHPNELMQKIYEVLLRTKCILTAFGESSATTDKFFKNFPAWKYIFIQHGQVFLKESVFLNGYILPEKYDKFLVCSQTEYNLWKRYGFSENKLLLCGLPRWDLLPKKRDKNNKEILMFFTWRRMQNILFDETLYKKNILSLIRNEKLNRYLKEHSITLYFAPHHALMHHAHTSFDISGESNIKVISTEKLSLYVRQCSCLVTDISSMAFDFMFQEKPVVFFIPDKGDPLLGKMDKEDLRRFNYKQDVLPNVCFNVNATVNSIIDCCENNFKIDDISRKIYAKFFYTKTNIRKQLIKELEKICSK